METNLLISEVKHLLDLEKNKKEEKKARGECFNIFTTMQMERNEVHTHSAVIAELLNPKGSHGCGNLFLNLFLQSIPEVQDIKFDTSTASVKVEYNIGSINKEYTEGGQIDILIQSGDKAIIIENKVDADDQPNQLFRYKSFADNYYPKNKIIYLTKTGKVASSKSLCQMSENDYVRISYQSTIKDWLSACIEKSANKPLVRETLVQYQNLILKITHQDMEDSTIKSISGLCKEADDLIAMLQIHNHFDSIMGNIVCKIFEDLADKHSLKLKVNGIKWGERFKAFSFINEKDWSTFEISFLFEKPDFLDLRCGFRYIDKKDNGKYSQNDTYEELKKRSEQKSTDRWPLIRKCKEYSNWKNEDFIASIFDEESGLTKRIEEDLCYLLDIAKELSEKNLSL